MSCTTGVGEEGDQAASCPQCGAAGKRVGTETVQALLSVTLRRVPPGARYRFCRTAGCEVVFFAPDHCFTRGELRVAVFQKSPEEQSTPVCYCFGYTVGDLCAPSNGARAQIVADVTEGVQEGQCACEIRNPQGSCCLGNVRAVAARGALPAG